MRMMFQTKVVEKIKTHILYSISFFVVVVVVVVVGNLAVCVIIWKNMIEPDRPLR